MKRRLWLSAICMGVGLLGTVGGCTAESGDGGGGSGAGGAGGAGGSGGQTACVPGATQACGCPGGGQGVQACLGDGSGFSACDCGSGGAGGGGGSGGGSCGPANCDGCCAGDTCLPGNNAAACGLGGEQCVGCERNFYCSTQRQCEVEPSSLWDLVIESAVVPQNKPNGDTWDAVGGLPDPFASITVGGQDYATSTKDDTLRPVWNEVVRGVRWDVLEAGVDVVLWDEDVSDHDVIGVCTDEGATTGPDGVVTAPCGGATLRLYLRPN